MSIESPYKTIDQILKLVQSNNGYCMFGINDIYGRFLTREYMAKDMLSQLGYTTLVGDNYVSVYIHNYTATAGSIWDIVSKSKLGTFTFTEKDHTPFYNCMNNFGMMEFIRRNDVYQVTKSDLDNYITVTNIEFNKKATIKLKMKQGFGS